MKIEGSVKPVGATPTGETRARSNASTAPVPDAAAKVELSSLSASLIKAEAAMASTPVVDRARVDEIRQAISEGRFTVDAERIADGLIKSVRELLDSGSRS
ncbi:MAG: flagellar biosynthesis anti-sigma factor FlgM [Aromatoleum sp.]|jgi:negative regulator of flagellin synthesis FlgM|uniref:flagellar biosynthesis anti-sigma factor FlgM n=1 Tax=Aromatoleum sp. TaxID=2307007 RepID=UPI002894FE59|nr:flagellar biosynthesis anti-sigma factor FlgM [Aromatoleum sp.]MDT3668926.1 flagellar biosynthesis anti-sigma factor FlgM [Aromatoleum sp.]